MYIFCMMKDIQAKFEAKPYVGLKKEAKNVIYHCDI